MTNGYFDLTDYTPVVFLSRGRTQPINDIFAAVAAGFDRLPAPDSFSANILLASRNRIINGDFRINQRGYVSAATLAAASYGHDRWKAGAAGGNYSFTQNPADTTITIATNKTLIQVVEDKNIEGGSYTLSWTGTATARIAISGASLSGAYAASPISVTGAGVGQAISVEFSAGTLGKVQLESGPAATTFDRVDYATMLLRCQRYYWAWVASDAYSDLLTGYVGATTQWVGSINLRQQMRAVPTMTVAGTFRCIYAGFSAQSTVPALLRATVDQVSLSDSAVSGLTSGQAVAIGANNDVTARLNFSAEL